MIKLWYLSQLETNDSTKTLSYPYNLNSENQAEVTVLNVNLKSKISYIHQASSDLSNVKIVLYHSAIWMPTADGRILSMDYINLNPFPFCFMQLMHISNSSLIFKQQQRRPRKYLKVLIFCSFSQFPQKQTNVAALECYIISSTQIIYTTKQACRRNWKGKPAT
jgi:hypothetical protein